MRRLLCNRVAASQLLMISADPLHSASLDGGLRNSNCELDSDNRLTTNFRMVPLRGNPSPFPNCRTETVNGQRSTLSEFTNSTASRQFGRMKRIDEQHG